MRPDRRRRGEFAAISLLALTFLAPLAGLLLGIVAAERRDLTAAVSESYIRIGEETDFFDSQLITMSLKWDEGHSIVAPSWAGTVTEIAASPGDVLQSGTRVARIDDIWRVAVRTPTPFFGPVSAGSGAREIQMLNKVLGSMGYLHGEKHWDWNTVLGIRQLADALGMESTDGLDVFDPAWVVWLPSEGFSVEEVLLAPGAPAPAPGEPILTGPAAITSASVTGSEASAVPARADSAEWEIVIESTTLPYFGPESQQPLELERLSRALRESGVEEVSAEIRRQEATRGHQVPSSAVFTDAKGSICVFRRSSTGKPLPILVNVEAGSIGTTRVSGELDPGDELLINVSEAIGSLQCD